MSSDYVVISAVKEFAVRQGLNRTLDERTWFLFLSVLDMNLVICACFLRSYVCPPRHRRRRAPPPSLVIVAATTGP